MHYPNVPERIVINMSTIRPIELGSGGFGPHGCGCGEEAD